MQRLTQRAKRMPVVLVVRVPRVTQPVMRLGVVVVMLHPGMAALMPMMKVQGTPLPPTPAAYGEAWGVRGRARRRGPVGRGVQARDAAGAA